VISRWPIDSTDLEILDLLELEGPATLSYISVKLGRSKSMVWRRLANLKDMGLVGVRRVGGITIAYRLYERVPPGFLTVGLLRASEYPYILGFTRFLKSRFVDVRIKVYDEAFKLALDLASNRVQLAMVPLPTLILAHRLSSGRVRIAGGGSYGGAFILEGRAGEGHSTTMASTMEMCAEKTRLEGPRRYKSSGGEILRSVQEGESRYGVVWEPYASMGRRGGLKATSCDVELCCLLGAHESVVDHVNHIARALEEAITSVRREAYDVGAYANLLELPVDIVKETVGSYNYYENPPVDVIKRNWDLVKRTVVPDLSLGAII
jgi:predicted transcriptional regulator